MILALQEKFKSKKISSVELTKNYLNRIKADKTNSYITICEDSALQQAKASDSLRAKGQIRSPLEGIPLGIKDILCTKGIRTTCASKILGDYKPPYNATVIERLKNAGTITLGKLNMDEFAMGGSNENSAFGPVKNPVNLEYVAGGSSGGSAAATKAGLAVATLGTDTGGSIRLPAAFTGTVGLKPTYGRVSRFGLVAFASSLDQIGPITVDVEDAALLMTEIAGHDPQDSTSIPKPTENFLKNMQDNQGKKLKIGLPKEYFVDGIDDTVRKSINDLKDKLSKAGHTFKEVTLPNTQFSVAIYYIVAVSEASSNLARFDGIRFGSRLASDQSLTQLYKKSRAQFGEEVKRRIILGTFSLSSGYYDAYYKKACQVRHLVKMDFDSVFKDVDILMTPVSPATAFKIGEKNSDPLKMYLNDIFTIPANLAGIPGLSVPIGRDQKGLPIGVQFLGPHFSEASLLSLGSFVEREFYKEEVSSHGI